MNLPPPKAATEDNISIRIEESIQKDLPFPALMITSHQIYRLLKQGCAVSVRNRDSHIEITYLEPAQLEHKSFLNYLELP